jgi:hypothetical protein
MELRIPIPFSKQTPAQILRKINHLETRLQKNYSPPVVMSLRDNELFQVIRDQMGWTSVQKITETQTIQGQMLAYQFCPVVSAVINKKCDMLRAGRWCIEDAKGNDVEKSSNTFVKLWKRPNPLQNWARFISQAYTMHQDFGRCYMLPVTGLTLDRSSAVYIIPNWLVTPNYTNQIYRQTDITQIIKSYTVMGLKTPVPVEDMIVWEDTTVSLSHESQYKIEAQSRLYSLTDQIVNYQTSYAARRTLLEKRGALGAWVNNNPKDVAGANPITPTEKEEVLKDFGEKYGVDRGKFPWLITSSFIKWEQAGFPTRDLMLFEEGKDDGLMIYDAFGLSVFLSPWADQTSYTNLEKAEKKAYTGTIIPDGEGLAALLTESFKLSDSGLTFKVYFDHLEIFQKSKKDEADALNSFTTAIDRPYKSKVITKEEYRSLISNFMPQGAEFDPENTTGEYFDGSPTQTIIAQ